MIQSEIIRKSKRIILFYNYCGITNCTNKIKCIHKLIKKNFFVKGSTIHVNDV